MLIDIFLLNFVELLCANTDICEITQQNGPNIIYIKKVNRRGGNRYIRDMNACCWISDRSCHYMVGIVCTLSTGRLTLFAFSFGIKVKYARENISS